MDIIKKISFALAKIVGVILVLIALLLVVFGVNQIRLGILYWMEHPYFTPEEELLIAIISFLIAFVFGFIGVVLFRLKKAIYYLKNREQILYEKELRRKEAVLNSQVTPYVDVAHIKRMQKIDAKNAKMEKKKREEEEARNTLMEKYTDKAWSGYTQDIKIHRCMGADMKWSILRIIAIISIVGSMLSIPLYAEYIDVIRAYEVIIFLIMLIAFWGGFFFLAISNYHRTAEKNTVFISTNERLLYKINFTDLHDRSLNIPASRVKQLIYFHNKSKEIEETQKIIDAFIHSERIKTALDGVVNQGGKGELPLEKMVQKLNSPILEKRLFGTRIKFWDEQKAKWDKVDLPKKIQGYADICAMIKMRNISVK